MRGSKLASLDIKTFNFPIMNNEDDRLLLANSDGLLMSLHDGAFHRDVPHRKNEPPPPVDPRDLVKEPAPPKMDVEPKKEPEVKKDAEPKKEMEDKKAEPKKDAQPKKEAEPKTEAEPKKDADPKKEVEPKKELDVKKEP